jgi:hypothetical protein
MRILLAIFFICLAGQAESQVYKCKYDTGETLISDHPCPGHYQESSNTRGASRQQQVAIVPASQKRLLSQQLLSQFNSSAPSTSTRDQGGYWVCEPE